MFKKIGIGLAILGGASLGVYFRFIRPWQARWGATDEEVHQPMPGDDEVSQANFQTTRAITIKARPAEVWSWLVQIGYGRAGFYSYAWIERALGLRSLSNAERILPEFQHLSVGDIIPLEPGGSGYRVASLEPSRLLVLTIRDCDGGNMGNVMKQAHGASTWVYMLHELDGEHTRLIVRWRARLKFSLKMPPSYMFRILPIEPGEFVMERKMLLGIKQRAEKAHEAVGSRLEELKPEQVGQPV